MAVAESIEFVKNRKRFEFGITPKADAKGAFKIDRMNGFSETNQENSLLF